MQSGSLPQSSHCLKEPDDVDAQSNTFLYISRIRYKRALVSENSSSLIPFSAKIVSCEYSRSARTPLSS